MHAAPELVTGFGASWDADPHAACGVLRAQASGAVPLRTLTATDAAAAVVAAHVWAVVTGETSLMFAYRHAPAGRAAAAAALLRAAGGADPVDPHRLFAACAEEDPEPCPDQILPMLAPLVGWVERHCADVAGVLATAAADLLTAGTGPLCAAGWLLAAEAEARLP